MNTIKRFSPGCLRMFECKKGAYTYAKDTETLYRSLSSMTNKKRIIQRLNDEQNIKINNLDRRMTESLITINKLNSKYQSIKWLFFVMLSSFSLASLYTFIFIIF